MRRMTSRSLATGCVWAVIAVGAQARAATPYASPDPFNIGFTRVVQPAMPHFGDSIVEKVTFFLTVPNQSLLVKDVVSNNGPDFPVTLNTCSNVTLTATHTCEVDIQFTGWNGTTPVVLQVNTTGTDNLDVSVATPALDLVFSPTTLDLGATPLLTPVTKTITVTNPNAGFLYPQFSFPLPGTSTMALSVGDDPNSCSYLYAHSSCQLKITYSPLQLGADSIVWQASTNLIDFKPADFVSITFKGTGTQSAVSVDLSSKYNVVSTVSPNGAPVSSGGLDRLGNVYPTFADTAPTKGQPAGGYGYVWQREQFALGMDGTMNSVANQTIVVPAGHYYGISLLGTAVYGPLTNQPIVLTYMDGTKSTVRQSFSDWKTPRFYAGESTAASFPARVTADGKTLHTGPYYLYGYSIPVDATKQLASVTLPPTRNVIALGMNLETTPRPISVDLSKFYNATVIRHDGDAITNSGFDSYGSALSYEQLIAAPQTASTFGYQVAAPGVPDAVFERTIPLPAGRYSALRLLGFAVNGAKTYFPCTVVYSDGTRITLQQSWSDWHYSYDPRALGLNEFVPGESNAFVMPYRLNMDGSKHAGSFMIYEYNLPLDATKSVLSITLPGSPQVLVLAMALVP